MLVSTTAGLLAQGSRVEARTEIGRAR